MLLVQQFLTNVIDKPETLALIYKDQKITYAETERRASMVVADLERAGVERGAHILTLLPNGLEFPVLMLAAAEVGAVLVPLPPSAGHGIIQRTLEACDCSYVVGTGPNIDKLAPELSVSEAYVLVVNDGGVGLKSGAGFVATSEHQLGMRVQSKEAPFYITMTSGSTGDPKPIVLTQHCKYHRAWKGAKELYCLGEDEVVLAASPLHHSLGFRLALLPLLFGGTGVILPRFSPELWLNAVQQHRVTFTIAVSSHLERILPHIQRKESWDISSLRKIVSSSALLQASAKQACLQNFSAEFYECYGASEIGIATTIDSKQCASHLGSVGLPLPYVDLQIADQSGHFLPSDRVGEIVCKSLTSFSGYYDQPKKTEESFCNGYFLTGDYGYLDKDGFLYFKGRKKEIINVAGANVYPGDVEEVVRSVTGVNDAVAIGVPDTLFGEAVVVVMEVNESQFQISQVKQNCFEMLADYQQPVAFEKTEQLPRNAMGKVLRNDIKQRFKNYDATAKLRKLVNE